MNAKVLTVFACLAGVGNGRRLVGLTQSLQSMRFADRSDQQMRSNAGTSPMNVFAHLLLGLHPEVAFFPAGKEALCPTGSSSTQLARWGCRGTRDSRMSSNAELMPPSTQIPIELDPEVVMLNSNTIADDAKAAAAIANTLVSRGSDSSTSLENLSSLRVVDLKAKCKDLGLKVSGTKAVLIARLEEFAVKQKAPAIEGPASATISSTTDNRKAAAANDATISSTGSDSSTLMEDEDTFQDEDEYEDEDEVSTKRRKKIRQHVNPLNTFYQQPVELSSTWLEEVFDRPSQPILLDIGCSYGSWTREYAAANTDLNVLGLEIRRPVVEVAVNRAKRAGLSNVHFLPSNANVDLQRILADLKVNKVPVKMLTIHFPDPHFKKRNHKRRVVNMQFVRMIAAAVPEDTPVFMQSDVEEVQQWMVEAFADSGLFSPSDGYDLNSLETNSKPFDLETEREIAVKKKGLPVYRMLFKRNGATCE